MTFHFRNSPISNNGTDVNAGQIAQVLYTPLHAQGDTTSANGKSGKCIFISGNVEHSQYKCRSPIGNTTINVVECV